MILRTVTTNTPVGAYIIIELHQDVDTENPLTNWDHPGHVFPTGAGFIGIV